MPQGGIDEGEKPRKAARRELLEEIGVCNATIIGESEDWLRYDLPENLVGKVWKGKYRGQEQRWFVMRFRGEDRDINLNATGHPEFSEWRWIPFEDRRILSFPSKNPIWGVASSVPASCRSASNGRFQSALASFRKPWQSCAWLYSARAAGPLPAKNVY